MIWEEDHEAAMAALRADHNQQLRQIAEWQKRIRRRLDRVEALAEKWENPAAGRAVTHREAAKQLRNALEDPE